MDEKRIVVCDKCNVKFAFRVPNQPGIYKIVCPLCKEEIKFRVINKKI